MGNGANKSITHGPVSQEIRTWLMFLSGNSWYGDYAVNTTNVHSRSLPLSSKPRITQVIDGLSPLLRHPALMLLLPTLW